MLPSPVLRHRRPIILATHVALVSASYAAAFLLAYSGRMTIDAAQSFGMTLGLLVILRLAAFAALGLHRGFYKHFGLSDLITLFEAVTTGTLSFVGVLLALGWMHAVPWTVPVVDWMITFLLAGGERLAIRYALEGRLSRNTRWNRTAKRVLVVGAGEAAERLIRQLSHDTDGALRAVALVDDDTGKKGRRLHGVPVVGTLDELEDVVCHEQIALVIIAISRLSPEHMRRIVTRCLAAKVDFKRLPSMHEMLQGTAKPGALTDVTLEHLLVREPVAFDEETVSRDLGGSVVLITGAAGSVGSELARQVVRARPSKLVLVDQAESPLYFVDLELRQAHPELEIATIIADITDQETVEGVFGEHKPDHVFHAAAYKHVPLMEANVGEAVRNNVWGTLCVARCAARFKARKFVLISTDKAVRPSSVMGATKRVAERIVLGLPSLQKSGTEMRAVRFGNVLGSEGSVVPLFRKQLTAGNPLTVTHPDVRRYFMTITEAAQLVLHATALSDAARRITMLDMGEPVRILELAENLIRLSGLEPHRDVPIVFTGLRPGEKLHEELMSSVERTVPTSVEKVSIVETDEVDGEAVQQAVERLLATVAHGEKAKTLGCLRELVPECVAPLAGTGVATASTPAAIRTRPARLVLGGNRLHEVVVQGGAVAEVESGGAVHGVT